MNKTILVVDDNPDILDAMQYTLEDAGYQVKITEKAEYIENLHDANGGLPALIILDLLLSGKDGRTICKKLKSQKETKHIPVIMISAHPDAARSVIEVGADNFIAKPFDIAVLLDKVAKYIK